MLRRESTLGRVLLVDDDPAVGELVVESLTPLGYEITTALSGEAGLHHFAAETFDAVVTDVNMPRMDGVELCRRIVLLRGEVPVLVMTSEMFEAVYTRSIRAGAYDVLEKPFRIAALAAMLQRALTRRPFKPK